MHTRASLAQSILTDFNCRISAHIRRLIQIQPTSTVQFEKIECNHAEKRRNQVTHLFYSI